MAFWYRFSDKFPAFFLSFLTYGNVPMPPAGSVSANGRTAATVSFNGAFLAAVAVVVGRSAGQAIQDSFGEPQNPIAFLVIIMYKLRNWLDKN